ncbi:MAG: hypothetical protein HY081_06135 [Gammaproteobacteria bacterium]|nr:hypothetical protein [Gammaproteobacteria bacterium]
MATKTLEELRTLARSQGMKNYSKLTRAELVQRLGKADNSKPAAKPAKPTARKKEPAAKLKSASSVAKPARAKSKKKTTPPAIATISDKVTPTVEWAYHSTHLSSDEERVENAKYASVLPGSVSPHALTADLNEDIDNLPPVTEPMLCLLPQKPGVLHGYWIIPSGNVAPTHALKLRLGRIAAKTLEIIEEIPLIETRGHWYFHLDESTDMGEVYLQLGYYEANGNFVSAIRRGIARIPTLHASEQTDRLWWVSDEQFRAMYVRAGGFVHGAKLGWAASIGSPSGGPSASSEQSPRAAKQNNQK